MDFLYHEIIIPVGGSITGEHGIGKIKTPYVSLEHSEDVIDLMRKLKKLFDPNLILNPGIGKGHEFKINRLRNSRALKNQKYSLLELNCMRCGFCNIICPSYINYKSEIYSPRGKLSILNGLVYGDINFEKVNLINEIFHTCTLCGLCSIKCPAGVETQKIFEKTREILHNIK